MKTSEVRGNNMEIKIELTRVEAIELPHGATGVWNRFLWEGVIDGRNYNVRQDVNVEFSQTYAVQYVQNLFNQKQKEIEA
jgi:hypothetical protein